MGASPKSVTITSTFPGQDAPHVEKGSWYSQSGTQLLAALDSSPTGLTEPVAATRLEQYGPNELKFQKTPAPFPTVRTTEPRAPRRGDAQIDLPNRFILLYLLEQFRKNLNSSTPKKILPKNSDRILSLR